MALFTSYQQHLQRVEQETSALDDLLKQAEQDTSIEPSQADVFDVPDKARTTTARPPV